MKRYFTFFVSVILSFQVHLAIGQCAVIETFKNKELKKRYTYLPNGNKVKSDLFKKGKPNGFKRYSYGQNGKISLVEIFNKKGEKKETATFTYDKNDNLIKIVYNKNGDLKKETTFVYKKKNLIERIRREKSKKGPFKIKVTKFTWENGNIVKSETFKQEGKELDLRKTTTYEYDTKKNPHFGGDDGVKDLSKNNIIGKKVVDRFLVENQAESYTKTVEYNAQGYPTKVIQKFNSGEEETKELKYKCQ